MSSKIKKLLIVCFFGPLPEWMPEYKPPVGYDLLLLTDLEDFNKRVKEKLGVESVVTPGTGKPWDYRPMLGYMYQDVLAGYDFWGHTDLDCVYGNVDKWVTDEFLSDLDVHSNHDTYVCGCWSLYRNTPAVNELFKQCEWKEFVSSPEPNGWVEKEFSRLLENSGLRYKYTFWQGDPWDRHPTLELTQEGLFQNGQEIMMFHFRHSKKWPLKQ